MIKLMRKLLVVLASFVCLSLTSVVFAQATPTPCPTPITVGPTTPTPVVPCGSGVFINITQPGGTGIKADTPLGQVVGNLITIIFSISALIVLIMIIWGGLEWIFSAGDKEKIGHARDRIIHALVGLALIALAFLLAKAVGSLINIDLLNLHLPALGPTP